LHGDCSDGAILNPHSGSGWVSGHDDGNRGILDKGGPYGLRHGKFFQEGLVRDHYKRPWPCCPSAGGTEGRFDDGFNLPRLHRPRSICLYTPSLFRKLVKHPLSFLLQVEKKLKMDRSSFLELENKDFTSLRSKTALMVKDYELKMRNGGRKLRDAPAWTGSLTAISDGSADLQDGQESGYFALFFRRPVVH
jgi:hypothetical protein